MIFKCLESVLTNVEIVESVWQKGRFLIYFPPIESFSAINQVADWLKKKSETCVNVGWTPGHTINMKHHG